MLIRRRKGVLSFKSFRVHCLKQFIPVNCVSTHFICSKKISFAFVKKKFVKIEPLFTNNHFKLQMNAILILSFRPPAFQCQYMGLKSTLYIICGFRFNLN